MRTSDTIVQLVDDAFDNIHRTTIEDYQNAMSPEQFTHEFGTICINLQRNVGHTYAAVELLTKYPNSILFVPNYDMKKHITRNADDCIHKDFLDDRVKIITNHHPDHFAKIVATMKHDKYDLIIIDGATQMKERFAMLQDFDYMHTVFGGKTKLFVELQ